MPSTRALQSSGVCKSYRRKTGALVDLDLSLEAGDLIALVGPNGAGKSTLLNLWLGFERPSEGTVRVFGVDPWAARPSALRLIGHVPQQVTVYRGLSVADHLGFAARARPTFDRRLAEARLEDLAISTRSRADELSGGQQAQLSLAIALGTRAPVLLLDEPLAGLDPLARNDVMHLLAETSRSEGTCALVSSHLVSELGAFFSHLVVLASGRKVIDGAVVDIVDAHWVAREIEDPDRLVGDFRVADGGSRSLGRGTPPSGVDVRSASIEEVVLGYLSAARLAATP